MLELLADVSQETGNFIILNLRIEMLDVVVARNCTALESDQSPPHQLHFLTMRPSALTSVRSEAGNEPMSW